MSTHHHHHGHVPQKAAHDPRYAEIRKVTLVGSVFDFLLGVSKIIVGYLSYSQALIADGIHSLSDLVTDFMVLYASKHASQDADEEHPYGHDRIETVTTVVLGAALILVAVGIAYDAIRRLYDPEHIVIPTYLALIVAVLSIVTKEAIYHYTMRSARRLKSNLLRANAWHSRSDAISSVIVVIGLIGSMAGLFYLDGIAAIAVGFMIAKIGWDLAYDSFRELIDTGLDAERITKIKEAIQDVDGVKTLHLLRTRMMGAEALVDVHIQVEPKLSVSEGHQISENVRRRLIEEIEEVRDVMVHIDPEDDENVAPNEGLSARKEILKRLHQRWQTIQAADHIKHVTLHYLNGKIHVDVTLPLDYFNSLEEARESARLLKQAGEEEQEISAIKVLFV